MSRREVARASVRSIATLLRIAIRSEPVRTVATLVLAMVVAMSGPPLTAFGVRLVVDGLIRHDASAAYLGIGLFAGSRGVVLLEEWALLLVRQRFQESLDISLDEQVASLALGIPSIEHLESPDLADQMNLIEASRGALGSAPAALSGLIGSVAALITCIVLLTSVNPWLIGLALLAIPPLVVGSRAQAAIQRAQVEVAATRRARDFFFALATAPRFADELKVYRLGDFVMAGYEHAHRSLDQVLRRAYARAAVGRSLASLLFALGLLIALSIVGGQVRRGTASPGDLALTLTLASQLNAQIGGGVGVVAWVAQALTAGRALQWLADYAASRMSPANDVAVAASSWSGPRLEIEGVSFRYSSDRQDALSGVSLTVPPGTTVALVGENGAGKSTLVKLLCRLYEPDSGRIAINGLESTQVSQKRWLANFTACFQDFARYEFRAREVVGIGDLSRIDDDQAILNAIDEAGVADLLKQLPEGLDTTLGRLFAGAVEPSGGQWQRLALARMFMRPHPQVTVLDEPASALDPLAEERLVRSMIDRVRLSRSAGNIVIIVSHRYSTVRDADLIVVMERGRIVETGTHDELLAADGHYANMFRVQAAAYR